MRSAVLLLIAVGVCVLLGGCAPGQHTFEKGQAAFAEQRYDEALLLFQQAIEEDPQRQEYRMMALSTRHQAALTHFKTGQQAEQIGDEEKAEAAYLKAIALAPQIPATSNALRDLRQKRIVREQLASAQSHLEQNDLQAARDILKAVRQLQPDNEEVASLLAEVEGKMAEAPSGLLLPLASRDPISIEFQQTELKEALKIMSKMSGINFVPDEGIQRQRVNLNLYDVTPAQALEVLLKLNGLAAKSLNDKTLFIYPKSKENNTLFDDYKIQTFYLSHITAKKAVNLLKSMLRVKSIFVHEERNALIMRERPEVLKVAARIIEAADRAEAEVMFEVEVIEVSHDNSQILGPQLSPYAISGGFEQGGNVVASSLEAGGSAANLVTGFSSLDTVYTLPTATFDFQKTLVDTEILANPKVRVKHGAKAKVHVGTREPVITVTTTGDSTSENVQYIDVGVKLDIEPKVDLDHTVVTKLSLEVSNVIERTQTENGTLVLSISTTNAESTLVLKDGERTIVGGLIRDDKTKTRKAIALLGDIPLLGDLLSNHNTTSTKREILLSIKPHILRRPDIPDATLTTTWSGSLTEIKPEPAFGSFLTPAKRTEDRPSNVDGASQAPSIPSAPKQPAIEEEQLSASAPARPSATEPILSLSSAPQAIQGQTFQVQIYTEDIPNLASVVLGIGYDPQQLEWIDATEGPLLGTGGSQTLFTANQGPEEGMILVGGKALQAADIPGEGILATLNFRGLQPGNTRLRFLQMQLRNNQGQTVAPQPEELELEILSANGGE